MTTYSIALAPKGGPMRLDPDRHKLLLASTSALVANYYGFNTVVVDASGACKHAVDTVIHVLSRLNWRVAYHNFAADDVFGRFTYRLDSVNSHPAELWISSPDGTGPGFNRYSRDAMYEGIDAACAKTLLRDRFARLHSRNALVYPELNVPSSLSKEQGELFKAAIHQLEKGYHGFNQVVVHYTGKKADVVKVKVILSALGWSSDKGGRTSTYSDFMSGQQLKPWKSEGPYIGRPEQILRLQRDAANLVSHG